MTTRVVKEIVRAHGGRPPRLALPPITFSRYFFLGKGNIPVRQLEAEDHNIIRTAEPSLGEV